MDEILESVKKRNRIRSISISDNLIKEIEEVTKGAISISGFIRLAVKNQIDKIKKLED